MSANGTTVVEMPAAAMVRHDSAMAIEPSSFTELRAMAKDAADSGFFPGVKSPAHAMMIMMAGRDLGFSYTQSLRAFHVIKDKVGLTADGMVAVCLSKPDICEYFKPIKETDTEAIWETKRAGQEPKQERFTLEDAIKAKLAGPNGQAKEMYEKYPRRMLSARAKAFLARDIYPELTMGLKTPEELREIAADREPQRVEATPVVAVEAASIDEEPSGAAQAYAVSISHAQTMEELVETGRAISDANLSDVDKAFVKPIYEAKRKELKKAGGR